MTDELMTNLRAAGDLLDERSEGALADAGGDGARILPLAPAIPSGRRRGQAVLASAAAVVLVMALVAAAAWNRNDDQIGVASGGQIAALVPSEGIGDWSQLDVHAEPMSPLGSGPATQPGADRFTGSVIVAPADASGARRMTESMRIMVLPDANMEDAAPGTEVVSGSGVEGHVLRNMGLDRVAVVTAPVPIGGVDHVIYVTAGPESTVEEMLAVAALVDPGTMIEDQTLEGWDTIGRANADREVGVSRTVYAETPGEEGRWLYSATLTGVSDEAIWWLSEPYVAEEIALRGKSAWMTTEDSLLTATWVEAPGVVVQLSYGPTHQAEMTDEELIAEAVAAAEDLVPVDQTGWDQFAAQATQGTDDNTTETTTMDSTTTTVMVGDGEVPALDPEERRAEHRMSGSLEEDGGWYHLWTDRDTGEICWELSTDPGVYNCEQPADQDGYVGIATEDGDRAVLVFGWLPEPGTFADVTVEGPDGSLSLRSARLGQPIWSAVIPPGYHPVEVSFATEDAEIVSTIDLTAQIQE